MIFQFLSVDVLFTLPLVLLWGQVEHLTSTKQNFRLPYKLVIVLETCATAGMQTFIEIKYPGSIGLFHVVLAWLVTAAFCIVGWFLSKVYPPFGNKADSFVSAFHSLINPDRTKGY